MILTKAKLGYVKEAMFLEILIICPFIKVSNTFEKGDKILIGQKSETRFIDDFLGSGIIVEFFLIFVKTDSFSDELKI